MVRWWGGKVVGHGEVRIRRDGCPSHEGKRVQRGVSTENPSAQLPRIEYSTVLLVAYTLDNHAIYLYRKSYVPCVYLIIHDRTIVDALI